MDSKTVMEERRKRRLSSEGMRLFRKSLHNGNDDARDAFVKVFKTFAFSTNGHEIFDAFRKVMDVVDRERKNESYPVYAIKDHVGNHFPTTCKRVLEHITTRIEKMSYSEELRKKVRKGNKGRALICGAGPIGLRMACELSLMGCDVTLCEKRSAEAAFNRFNILHLWEYTAEDLYHWGIPRKEIAGDDMHIGTNTVQMTLLRAALLLGVDVRMSAEYVGLSRPGDTKRKSWSAKIREKDGTCRDVQFDTVVGCGGARDRLSLDRDVAGFGPRSKYRSGTNIGIVMMFHRKKPAEGPKEFNWSAHFNRKLFDSLKKNGFESENVVYYKDPHVHYIVFTPTVRALVKAGVIRSSARDADERLLYHGNVDHDKLMDFAMGAAKEFEMPVHNGLTAAPGIFDFSERTKGEEAARLLGGQNGEPGALAMVAGDALMEPFWPEGLGMNRGFLTVLDASWIVKRWTAGEVSLQDALQERDDLYYVMRDLAAKTRCQVLTKQIISGRGWSVDPATRYHSGVYPPSRQEIALRKAEARARKELNRNRKCQKREDPRKKDGFLVSKNVKKAMSKMNIRKRNRYLTFKINDDSTLELCKKGLREGTATALINHLPRRGCRFAVWCTSRPDDRVRGPKLLILWKPTMASLSERERYEKALPCAKSYFSGMKVLLVKRGDDLKAELEPSVDANDSEEDDWLSDM